MGVLLGDDPKLYKARESYRPSQWSLRPEDRERMKRWSEKDYEPQPDPKGGMLIVGLTLMFVAVLGLYLLVRAM